MKHLLQVFCLLVFFAAANVWAQAQEKMELADVPQSSSVDIRSYEGVSTESAESPGVQQLAGNKTVVLYSTTWCGICERARRFFQVHKIPFQEFDVEKTQQGRDDYKKLNGRGVPIILLGEKRMNGFSVKRFRQLYEAAEQ